VRRLRRYAQQVQAGQPQVLPDVPGELGELAQAMQRMRQRLDGREYVEHYVRALTHELKSPLAALRASGELLQEDLPAPQRAEFAHQVVAQTERMQRLIDHLLELSRLEQRAGEAPSLHPAQPLRLLDCVQTALDAATSRLEARQITPALSVAEDAHTATVAGDARAITLAVSNLIENALDFAPAGSTLRIAVEPQRIVVHDQGPGVPDYALARLGERFYTTPRPDGERSGSGLGLAIVRQIMALHGGSLQLANDGGLRAELRFGEPPAA